MATSSTVDVIEKLIQLALKNPNREEAASAALKAVTLIDKYSVPLGAEVHILREGEWQPPDEDFKKTVDDILKSTNIKPDHDLGPGLMIQSREMLTREEAFRAQMRRAWQAIREERRKVEAWAHTLRAEFRRDYWGANNPKPW
jgi:hypothetical protein